MSQVHICEVGPRDGLQNAKHLMPTAAKKAWIRALADAGLKEIEVGSFVPPKLIPAMADTGEVVAFARTIPGLKGVALADTVGYANPAQVRRLFSKVRKAIGAKLDGAHFHNTRGLGLANALAAYEEGVRAFDSSMGGLGGCPFAPGASGNVITEDLVFMFESMGVSTGVDFDALLKARRLRVQAIPEEPVYGHTPLAGLPKGFRASA